ncbi:hypothetical protein GO011_22375 [Mycobacterium sp. 20091114027_K0903767]|nr:hypothetical protein [Mycobacterium sp. 20091114027_K0903767]OCB45255.1 hypothetical protein A5721_16940 [Mycolicibacterium vulneris]
MTNFGGQGYGFGAPPQYGYGVPAPIPTSPPTAERTPPVGQILISTLLILPTIPIFYVGSRPFRRAWLNEWPLGVTMWLPGVVLALYLVVVVACWARPGRRLPALAIAVVVALLDTLQSGISHQLLGGGELDLSARPSVLLPGWFYDVAHVLILVGYVAAWGIARRSNMIWTVGLVGAVVSAVVVQWIHRTEAVDVFKASSSWINAWAVEVGAFVLSCLICWAVDAIAAASRRPTTPQIPGR